MPSVSGLAGQHQVRPEARDGTGSSNTPSGSEVAAALIPVAVIGGACWLPHTRTLVCLSVIAYTTRIGNRSNHPLDHNTHPSLHTQHG